MIKYSKEFKQEAVKIGLNSDHPYSKTAQELGVHPKTFYNWIKAHISSTQSRTEDMETIKLRKELRRTQQELEIVKKAAAYFAKHLK